MVQPENVRVVTEESLREGPGLSILHEAVADLDADEESDFRQQQDQRIIATIGHKIGPRADRGNIPWWDDFARSDRDLVDDNAPSRQVYSTNSLTDGIHMLTDGFYRPLSVPAQGDVLYAKISSPPGSVVGDVAYEEGTTGKQNIILGTTGATFINDVGELKTSNGFGQGSVQLAMSPRAQLVSGIIGYDSPQWAHWWLFTPPNPIFDPYPSYIFGTFDGNLIEDGKTLYRIEMHLDEYTDQISVVLPDGTSHTTPTLPGLTKYWGPTIGIQVRRPLETDGYAKFARASAHGVNIATQQPATSSILRFA